MKAGQFGTWTEQLLFRMGYKTAKERPQCWTCHHAIGKCQENGSVNLRCTKADTTTTRSAVCNEWEVTHG